jgi:hypothetical protein
MLWNVQIQYSYLLNSNKTETLVKLDFWWWSNIWMVIVEKKNLSMLIKGLHFLKFKVRTILCHYLSDLVNFGGNIVFKIDTSLNAACDISLPK